MADANQPLGGTAIKPVGWDRTGWEAFKYMLFDPDNGTILTRTPLSWLKITVFYIIYYTFLACFWIACLVIFFQTLPEEVDGPKWQQDWGLIGNNPGVGLRPRNTDARIDSQMFVLQGNDENIHPSDLDGEGDLNADYAVRVNKFLAAYEKTPSPAAGNGDHAFKGYEAFDPKVTLGDCGKFPYGYVGKKVTPCIFFKLNNIWGWEPKPVKCATNNDALEPEIDAEDGLPKDLCPDSLKAHMNSAAGKGVVDDSIFIDCRGRNVADQEALAGKISYFPASRALPIKYFPYLGQRNQVDKEVGYHSPLVAIQVDPATKGQLVHMECRAYYRGVKHDKKHKLGLVQFEVQVL